MKRLMLAFTVLMFMVSCDITVIEPRYTYDHRDELTGYYDMEEYSETFHDYTYYSIHVTKDTYSRNTVYLNNFYGADICVKAYVDYNDLTIPYQVVDGFEIEGTGTLYDDHVDMSYSVRDRYQNSRTDFCNTYGGRDY